MCRVDLHATKPCVLRQLCCLGEVRRKLLNFAQRHPFTLQAFTLQVGQVEFARRRSPPLQTFPALGRPSPPLQTFTASSYRRGAAHRSGRLSIEQHF